MRKDLVPTDFDGRVARINEECGEVVKCIGKIYRFGYTATDGKTGKQYNNVMDLLTELTDLRHAIDEMLNNPSWPR